MLYFCKEYAQYNSLSALAIEARIVILWPWYPDTGIPENLALSLVECEVETLEI